MKRVLAVLFGLILLFSILPSVVVSQENNETDVDDGNNNETEVDDETEKQIKDMNTPLGAQMRVFQLEKAITKFVLKAEVAVEYLKEKERNTTEIEGILSELKLVMEEIKNIPMNISKEESVKNFVDMKKDARDLIKDFRKAIKGLLEQGDREEIAKRVKDIDLKSDIEKIRERIRLAKNEANAERVKKMLEHMGTTDDALISRVKTGEIKVGETVSELKNRLKEMNGDKKIGLRKRLNESYTERERYASNKVQELKETLKTRLVERTKARASKLEASGLRMVGDKLRARADSIEKNIGGSRK